MSIRNSLAALLVVAFVPVAALAQTYSAPTPKPALSAADRDWFLERRPIRFAGDWYYPGGARYHFDPQVMVETGAYEGVPLYADTTATPYDEVLVPIGGGLMQPYQRLRTGALAGTTGSHVPDYPIDVVPWETSRVQARRDTAPPPQPAPTDVEPRDAARQLDEDARLRLLQPPGRIQTILEPQDNRGIWIRYEGQRWDAAGEAVRHEPQRFAKIGEYFGFPVFSAAGREEIFIPAVAGKLAAYRKAGK